MTEVDSIRELTAQIREFAVERDWEQFHDPKSLILALVGEVGELAELFQWIRADTALADFSDPNRKQRVAEELSDILTYLLRLADTLQVDLAVVTPQKLADSNRRFPPDRFQGIAPQRT